MSKAVELIEIEGFTIEAGVHGDTPDLIRSMPLGQHQKQKIQEDIEYYAVDRVKQELGGNLTRFFFGSLSRQNQGRPFRWPITRQELVEVSEKIAGFIPRAIRR